MESFFQFKQYRKLERIWSILTKLLKLRFSGGHFQTNATITSFEGLVGVDVEGFMEEFGHLNTKN